MTESQYKNIINNTLLDETLEGVMDSVIVARAILDNCGIPLPKGDCGEILNALSSDDFVGWRKCTLEEAQEHANNGIAALGISEDRIMIIEPQDSRVLTEKLPATVVYRSSIATMDSLNSMDMDGLVFYADTMGTTTQPVGYYRIKNKPTGNALTIGETKKIRLDTNLPMIGIDTYWSSSNSAVATLSPTIDSPFTTITTKSTGTTNISIHSPYNGGSDSFTLTVLSYYTMSFNANGGSGAPGNIYPPPNQYVYLPNTTPTREGYVFNGWGLSSTSNSVAFLPGTKFYGAAAGTVITLYAVWEKYMQIYISPANHTKPYTNPNGGLYPIDEWNEKKNMEIVGDYLKSFLEGYHVEIYLDKTDRSGGQQNYKGRPEEANNWITNKNKCLYLALHSNAAKNPPSVSDRRGATGFYNGLGQTESLSEAFADAINLILPPNGVTVFKKSYNISFGELKWPNDYGIPAIILENSFHDNPEQTSWLINNQAYLAETIGGILVSFFNLKHK